MDWMNGPPFARDVISYREVNFSAWAGPRLLAEQKSLYFPAATFCLVRDRHRPGQMWMAIAQGCDYREG